MSRINPGYNNGVPLYWRDETSGKMEAAVMEFFAPYAGTDKVERQYYDFSHGKLICKVTVNFSPS